MRLLNAKTKRFEVFEGDRVPGYAILSHTWGHHEVLYEDIKSATSIVHRISHASLPRKVKDGYSKIELSCKQAEKDGHDYVWIDTCCIDKSSSADLSESINLMFDYYRKSKVCYVFLSDYLKDLLEDLKGFELCRWFTRGWTLQELLAPSNVHFYDQNWNYVGSKATMVDRLSAITGIQPPILLDSSLIDSMSVAQRMSWMCNADGRCRQTTRVEDLAYSLIGIMGVNMPLLYGEGQKAFIRLQEEIMKWTDDQSLFAWQNEDADVGDWYGLFASHPKYFCGGEDIVSFTDWKNPSLASVTSSGLSINLPLTAYSSQGDAFLANLNCRRLGQKEGETLSICLCKVTGQGSHYSRVLASKLCNSVRSSMFRHIYVRQRPAEPKQGDLNLESSFRVDIDEKVMRPYKLRSVIYKDEGGAVKILPPGDDTVYHLGSDNTLSAAFVFDDSESNERLFVLLGCAKIPGRVMHSVYSVFLHPKGSDLFSPKMSQNPQRTLQTVAEDTLSNEVVHNSKLFVLLETHFAAHYTDAPMAFHSNMYFDIRWYLDGSGDCLVVEPVITTGDE